MKISFNPYHTKQAQEIIFCGKISKRNHPSLMFDNNKVDHTTTHKLLGIILESKLSIGKYFSTALSRISNIFSLLQKFQEILPRATLLPFINYLSDLILVTAT